MRRGRTNPASWLRTAQSSTAHSVRRGRTNPASWLRTAQSSTAHLRYLLISLTLVGLAGCASPATVLSNSPESLEIQVSTSASDLFVDAVSVAPRILVAVDAAELGMRLAESGSSLRLDDAAAEYLADQLIRELQQRNSGLPVLALHAGTSAESWDLVLDISVTTGSRWVVRLDSYLFDATGIRPEIRIGSVTVGWDNTGPELSPRDPRVSAALVPLLVRTLGGPPLQFDRQRLMLPEAR